MTAKIINGNQIAKQLRAELKVEVDELKSEHGVTPGLAVVLVGEDPASKVYVRNKHRACERVGIESIGIRLPADASHAEVMEKVEELNENPDVHWILVQLPTPEQIDDEEIINTINSEKDVDGFHPVNMGKLLSGQPEMVPCTPTGVMYMLDTLGIDLTGKEAVIVGRSNIVGKPQALLLMYRHCTITICHSRTKDLAGHTSRADILVAATGVPKMITRDMVKPGAVVMDVGISRLEDGSLVGDVDFDEVKEVASAITPVPGGVGPMTIAMLLKNTVRAARKSVTG
ncbi:MAG: bifunctional methylenetetrahydrofolate dehydrogenase/methenyltetrahydrofolate cyclohydrolase FolD [Bacillota bacterium]